MMDEIRALRAALDEDHNWGDAKIMMPALEQLPELLDKVLHWIEPPIQICRNNCQKPFQSRMKVETCPYCGVGY